MDVAPPLDPPLDITLPSDNPLGFRNNLNKNSLLAVLMKIYMYDKCLTPWDADMEQNMLTTELKNKEEVEYLIDFF